MRLALRDLISLLVLTALLADPSLAVAPAPVRRLASPAEVIAAQAVTPLLQVARWIPNIFQRLKPSTALPVAFAALLVLATAAHAEPPRDSVASLAEVKPLRDAMKAVNAFDGDRSKAIEKIKEIATHPELRPGLQAALLEGLKSSKEKVVMWSVICLGRYGDEKAIASLMQIYERAPKSPGEPGSATFEPYYGGQNALHAIEKIRERMRNTNSSTSSVLVKILVVSLGLASHFVAEQGHGYPSITSMTKPAAIPHLATIWTPVRVNLSSLDLVSVMLSVAIFVLFFPIGSRARSAGVRGSVFCSA